jgi:hypothetical protein
MRLGRQVKAIEWQQSLQRQRERHGKVVFTVTELVNVCGGRPASTRVAVQRLVTQGVLERYLDGRYGLPGVAAIEDLVPSIDPAAYITGMYALYRHQLVTQASREVRCFTNRRHNRSRVRNSSRGRIVFVCLAGSAYAYPADSVIASPEQALCDFVYDCRRRGLAFTDLVTFRNLDRLHRDDLEAHLARYPGTVARDITELLTDLWAARFSP